MFQFEELFIVKFYSTNFIKMGKYNDFENKDYLSLDNCKICISLYFCQFNFFLGFFLFLNEYLLIKSY